MTIKTHEKDSTLFCTIWGEMSSYAQFLEFKSIINKSSAENITLHFKDCERIDAYILGYILSLKKPINIIVGSGILYNFLEKINYNRFFNIKIQE